MTELIAWTLAALLVAALAGSLRLNSDLREEVRGWEERFAVRVDATVEQRWLTVKYQPLMATAGTDHWPFKGHCLHNMRLDVPCEKCMRGEYE